jgi:hypothetical protein
VQIRVHCPGKSDMKGDHTRMNVRLADNKVIARVDRRDKPKGANESSSRIARTTSAAVV